MTARHLGFSPDAISRWALAYQQRGLAGLEPRSLRPKRLRQLQVFLAVVQPIQALREQYPRWGREKLRVLAKGRFDRVVLMVIAVGGRGYEEPYSET